jgi:hypothetical protein
MDALHQYGTDTTASLPANLSVLSLAREKHSG